MIGGGGGATGFAGVAVPGLLNGNGASVCKGTSGGCLSSISAKGSGNSVGGAGDTGGAGLAPIRSFMVGAACSFAGKGSCCAALSPRIADESEDGGETAGSDAELSVAAKDRLGRRRKAAGASVAGDASEETGLSGKPPMSVSPGTGSAGPPEGIPAGGDAGGGEEEAAGRFRRRGETSLVGSSLMISVPKRGGLNADAQK